MVCIINKKRLISLLAFIFIINALFINVPSFADEKRGCFARAARFLLNKFDPDAGRLLAESEVSGLGPGEVEEAARITKAAKKAGLETPAQVHAAGSVLNALTEPTEIIRIGSARMQRYMDAETGEFVYMYGKFEKGKPVGRAREIGFRVTDKEKHFGYFIANDAGSPAREFFQSVVQDYAIEAGRSGKKPMLISIDIDDLDKTNAFAGLHNTGDEYLDAVAEAIGQSIKKDDILVRSGGDEFIVLLPDIKDGDPEQILRRIESAVANSKRAQNVFKKQRAFINSFYETLDRAQKFDDIPNSLVSTLGANEIKQALGNFNSFKEDKLIILRQEMEKLEKLNAAVSTGSTRITAQDFTNNPKLIYEEVFSRADKISVWKKLYKKLKRGDNLDKIIEKYGNLLVEDVFKAHPELRSKYNF